MSTRSTIVWNDGNSHIYYETSEPHYFFGKYLGDNIYFCLDWSDVSNAKLDKDRFFIKLNESSELAQKMGTKEIVIFGGSILELETDSEGIIIVVQGGSIDAKNISMGKWDIRTFNFKDLSNND